MKMNRFRTFFLTLALTALFAGNIFAMGTVVSASLPTSLIAYAVNAVLFLMADDDKCPLRQCTNCRPNNEGNDDGDGDCRPGR